jgi:hypothetical protein
MFQVYLTTIKNETNWIQQLMYLLSLHTDGLENYERVSCMYLPRFI